MLVKTVVNKSDTAMIIKFNWKINDKNLAENNKSNLWKVKKINNRKQAILYFDTISWNVCKIKEIHINIHFGWEEWWMGRLIWRRQDRDSFLIQVGIKLNFSEFILIFDLVFGFYCSEQK